MPPSVRRSIIDFIHVIEYLWKAAWVRHEAPP